MWVVGSAQNGCIFVEDPEDDQTVFTEIDFPSIFGYKQVEWIECGTKHCICKYNDGGVALWGEHINPNSASSDEKVSYCMTMMWI